MNLRYGTLKILTLLVMTCFLSACITLPGHRQIVDEGDLYILIETQSGQEKSEIRFNPEQGEIVELPLRSRITLLINDNRGKHEMVIKNVDSATHYEYKRNGRKAPFDDAARRWFEAQIPMIVEKTGLRSP